MVTKSFLIIIILISGIFNNNALAEVSINGTRIIFNAKDNESRIQLKNNGKSPYLLQLWIDDGNPKARPGESNVPFLINPPVIRIDPEKGQAIHITAPSITLPQEKESLFWFNMLEIPPKSTATDASTNQLQLALRTRVKLFYRPNNLIPEPVEAYKNLTFSLNENILSVKNPSPYYITFSKIEIRKSKNTKILGSVEKFPEHMIAPNGGMKLSLTIKEPSEINKANLFYNIINDFGGETINKKPLDSIININ